VNKRLHFSSARAASLRAGRRREEVSLPCVPGTSVPGYRLWRPRAGTASGASSRHDKAAPFSLALDYWPRCNHAWVKDGRGRKVGLRDREWDPRANPYAIGDASRRLRNI
jgi:hypothetical protein